MATTGTYSFQPPTSSLVLSAFARVGIRRTAITAQHMADAYIECNLTQVDLSNKIPNLWLDELFEQELTASDPTITLPTRLVAFQAPYITTESSGVSTDRIISAMSTFEYSAVPDKTQEGPPVSFWLNMQTTPEITFWPVPDGNATYTFKARMLRQIQDASLANGVTTDIPYRWLDVYVAQLAYRFARIYAPQFEDKRMMDAERAWAIAATTDKEQVPLYIVPNISSYWN